MNYRICLLVCLLLGSLAFAQKTEGPAVNEGGATPTSNDECAAAIPITDLGTIELDISGNTPNASDPAFSCQSGGSDRTQTTWYTFTPFTDGTINISACNTEGSSPDSLLGVYTGSCGSLAEVACGEDECGLLSEITGLDVTAGTTYYLLYADWGTVPNTGLMRMEITGDNVFVNPIPTLGEYGMMAFVALLAIAGVFFMRRRNMQAA
ncbi:IPTL-CTERM sorting domain-containing protein [Sulfidibacter corallicola]|uniref:IPTL-CTERM sorting domain-containing protein n=1 Tax=Sulfidibacter corallicola TaxID=2818388 RepID=A0A8A4TND2_SULCO|nr:IPTL-CTERM sorting domain-containing protein [Sulfidibacter corallicola]QTD51476.1 IPTL-CTERM sorting domain-containing protein [Sulfidibacter corallicola]